MIVAADASQNTWDRLLPLLAARNVAHVVGFERAALGGAVGRSSLGAVGLRAGPLARRLAALLGADGAEGAAGNSEQVV